VKALIIWAGSHETVVIVHKKTKEGLYAYGHAAADNFRNACRRAVVELARHEYVIHSYWLAKACGCSAASAPTDLLERRSVYFASEEGHEDFARRARTGPHRRLETRRIAFDGKIPGPWEKYAHVWRVVFHPVTDRYLHNDNGFFLW